MSIRRLCPGPSGSSKLHLLDADQQAHLREVRREHDEPVAQLEQALHHQALRQGRARPQGDFRLYSSKETALTPRDAPARLPGQDPVHHAELHQMPPSTKSDWALM